MSIAVSTESPGSQNPGPREVEAAVRSVLIAMMATSKVPTTGVRNDLEVFAGRLLSLGHVQELSPKVREVRIAPGTVITPLAKDHLKRSGIEIRWVSRSEADAGRNVGEWGFAIESEIHSGVVEAFRRSLLDGSDAWRELTGSIQEAANWVCEGKSRGALVLVEEASVAVFRACRIEGVRPASAEDFGALAKGVRALGANLIVVEPTGKSIATLRQMALTFRRAGGPKVPEWLRSESTAGGSR